MVPTGRDRPKRRQAAALQGVAIGDKTEVYRTLKVFLREVTKSRQEVWQMSSMNGQRDQLRSGERGSIMIMTAIFALLLLLMVGLCLDVSRIYLVRAELQNAAEAAALAGARQLNGGAGGIDAAVAKAMSLVNSQGLRAKTNVTIATVEFAVFVDGPYMTADAVKANTVTLRQVQYVRVTTNPTTTNILFASSALGATHVESRQAIAGMSIGLTGICDFFPAAVALSNPSPSPGELMTLNFNQGTPTGITLADKDFAILEINNITGTGAVETATLCAGIPNLCKSSGDQIHMTPSSNPNNGPLNCGDGMNTRFNVYANGPGNLSPADFPPDTNVKENISATDYKDKTPGQVTAPSPNGPGKDERRLLIAPIIAPGNYPAYATNIVGWGVFFLKALTPTPSNCSHTPGCGAIPVEYAGVANVSATGDPSCSSPLRTPVLYR
jgi:Flp pilus assembly protein TadG